ncbi:MAG: hypothetical protein HY390_06215 [Deltaproteobacteria bacterium]|nr:hypothetical protein [Deltaproteobacteria bacterium]
MSAKFRVFWSLWVVAGVVGLGLLYGKSSSSLKVFYPEMKPAVGAWGKPSHRIGEKPTEIWSNTTVEAGVLKKPLEGKVVTRVGEIIDVSCYTQLGKHGADHAECAKSCLLEGEPMGLLEENGTVYLLVSEEHDARRDGQTVLKEALINHVAHIVEVTGTYTNVNGLKTIFVQGFVKKD